MKRRARVDWKQVRARLESSAAGLALELEGDDKRLQDVLESRAAAFADRARQRRAAAGGDSMLVVELAGGRYALPVERLAEVVPLRRITPVPLGPSALLGVMNLRGAVRSVIDLALVMGIGGEDRAPRYAIMVRGDGLEIGLAVDRVDGIRGVREESVRPAPAGRCIAGLLEDGTGLIDVNAVVGHEALGLGGSER